jgi:hypothetical protein
VLVYLGIYFDVRGLIETLIQSLDKLGRHTTEMMAPARQRQLSFFTVRGARLEEET